MHPHDSLANENNRPNITLCQVICPQGLLACFEDTLFRKGNLYPRNEGGVEKAFNMIAQSENR